jgi:phosphoglycerate dehydrogenase-like enzyme
MHVAFITSPLEPEHVARMRAIAPNRVEIVHEPDLLPPVRYQGDHNGAPDFALTAAQMDRWRSHLARATILWDFPPDGLASAPNVRWVQTTSSGIGQRVARLGLVESDLIVTTARGVHADALAEFVFLVLLGHTKDLARLQRDQRARHWERYCGGELAGKAIAVIGAGQVGARVGAIARAFNMQVLAVVSRPTSERKAELCADEVLGPQALHAALARADYVVLATPHTPQTERMIDAAALAAMKRGAVLINIARGQVVDEAALIAALRSGHVGAAALDVAEIEPLPASSPLWDMPNVLISPHSASTAPSENAKITDIFCHNLGCYLDNRFGDMRNVLDKRRMY